MDINNLDYSVIPFLLRKVGHYKTRNLRYYDNKYRYIQFWTSYDGDANDKYYIHYELIDRRIELHFEGSTAIKEAKLIDYLQKRTASFIEASVLEWFIRDKKKGIIDACRLLKRCDSIEEAAEMLIKMMDIFDKHIQAFQFPNEIIDLDECSLPAAENEFEETTDDVSLFKINLSDLLNLRLRIPSYQRIYCWPKKNVIRLLDDIFSVNGTYMLGAVILQRKEERYDIIDGQQRLITLALILQELSVKIIPLLAESFQDSQAIKYISYNRYIIQQYLKKSPSMVTVQLRERILKNLEFFALVLNNNSIDLAYTFFSNENSRGQALTDFDLLKAHHLRYVDTEAQTRNLAKRWNQMLLNSGEKEEEKPHVRTLDLYIFRLRKWMRKNPWNEKEKYRVKNEYEAALTIDEIPAFGESFDFYEPIQGGAHFFNYVDVFVEKFRQFTALEQYKLLHDVMKYKTHWMYRDVIEALLFAYYLKFGSIYFNEAFILICTRISQFRLETSKVDYQKLLERAGDTEIVQMIDQATSPTFFLKELLNVNRELSIDQHPTNIRADYCSRLRTVLDRIDSDIEVINTEKTWFKR